MAKNGLVMSGGGARGIAHLGVLQALDELGIHVDEISATSAGAMCGAFYLAGHKPYDAMELFHNFKMYHWLYTRGKAGGILNMKKFARFFSKHLPETFEQLNGSLTICATDLFLGELKYFNSGPLVPAICASSCIPVVFTPIAIDEHMYVDGGVLNNFPTEPLETHFDNIIGVHVNPVDSTINSIRLRNVMDRCMHLAIGNQLIEKKKICAVFIEPKDCMHIGMFDLNSADKAFKIGYDAAMEQKKELLLLK
jgi:NTE family protein